MAKDNTKSRRETPAASSGVRKGRFKTAMDPEFARFNASISFDKRLFEEDVRGSIAHAKMLGRQGMIPRKDAKLIEEGLKEVLEDFRNGRFVLREDLEDVHINVEQALRDRIGEVAGRLHTARSRNDQVALDLRMYVRAQIDMVLDELSAVMTALTDCAEQNIDIIMPGYTHLQRAQPVRLSHHLMAYVAMLRRDAARFSECRSRTDEMPLGSAALAGSTFPVDREFVAQELGFSRVSANSLDAVSDRDFAAEFIFDCCLLMMHLSRLSEELIIWSSSEFGFCTLPDAFCSGSSIMPQKKNPDACELIRGKTGRVYGDLTALLTTLKALPLTYNKDLQEDKEPLFDAADTVHGVLRILAGLIPGIRFHAERMQEAASDPALAATDLADALVRQGIPFREAHERIGSMIREASTKEGKKTAGVPSPEDMVEARDHVGGTSRERVLDQIREARAFLQSTRQREGRAHTRGHRKRNE